MAEGVGEEVCRKREERGSVSALMALSPPLLFT